MLTDTRVNDLIQASSVLLIDEEGDNHGRMDTSAAMEIAESKSLDLVQVSSPVNGEPPVCKIMNYGKFKYQKSKKMKRKSTDHVKEIRVSYTIATKDLETKCEHMRKFLRKNLKVRFSMALRGRERAHMDEAVEKMNLMLETFADVAVWDKPQINGRYITTFLRPK